MVIAVFWTLTALCCGYAVSAGGRDARCAVAMVGIAIMVTKVVQDARPNWGRTHTPVMLVDEVLLIGLMVLALRSRSYWPMWMAAAQFLTVASHVATLLTSGFNQKIYAGLVTVWSIPCLLSMVIGVFLDRRALLNFTRPCTASKLP